MLEARELLLRRRFETIVQELTETRDGLVRIELAAAEKATPAAAKDALALRPPGTLARRPPAIRPRPIHRPPPSGFSLCDVSRPNGHCKIVNAAGTRRSAWLPPSTRFARSW